MAITWWAIPLAAVISLVWNASRYEQPRCIVFRATRMFFWLVFFLVLIGGVLFLLSHRL
ncbi:MAG: hypothetical protein KF774_10030 [Planctomyces sp.]|nr:hypothetical protein [Planctomyces sp.]